MNAFSLWARASGVLSIARAQRQRREHALRQLVVQLEHPVGRHVGDVRPPDVAVPATSSALTRMRPLAGSRVPDRTTSTARSLARRLRSSGVWA